MRFHRMLNSTRPSFPLPSRWAAVKEKLHRLNQLGEGEAGRRERQKQQDPRTVSLGRASSALSLGGLGEVQNAGPAPPLTGHKARDSVSASQSLG